MEGLYPVFTQNTKLFASPPRAPKGPLGPRMGPEGAPGSYWVPWAPGSLGPEALRASGLGKHGLAITRSALDRHGLSKGCGLAVFGEASLGSARPPCVSGVFKIG